MSPQQPSVYFCLTAMFHWLLMTISVRITPVFSICPSQCRCNMSLQTVECINGRLEHFPIQLNPRVRRIFLDGNRISDLHGSFDYYHQLRSLSLRFNQLTELATRTFEHQGQLQHLDLSGNRIVVLSPAAFNGLSQLQHLNLSDNLLQKMPAGVLVALKQLRRLSLARNRLNTLSFIDLESLRNRLEWLDLSGNTFVLPPDFTEFQSLRTLWMKDNRLVAFPSLSSSTELVDVSNNSIKTIGINQLTSRISHINVSYNLLEHSPQSQSDLANLSVLDISGNRINYLNDKSFTNFKSLEKLYCSNQKRLVSIKINTLIVLPKLTEIHICNNKNLRKINDLLLRSSSLENVILNRNSLTAIPTPPKYSNITFFDIRDNILTCECRFLWLTSWIVEKRAADFKCFKPPQLRGRLFSTLDSSSLGCQSQYLLLVVLISVPLVFCVMIICLFVALCRRNKTANSSNDAFADLAINSCKEAFTSPPLYLVPLTSDWDLAHPADALQRTSLTSGSQHHENRVVSLYSSSSSPYLFDDSTPEHNELSALAVSSSRRLYKKQSSFDEGIRSVCLPERTHGGKLAESRPLTDDSTHECTYTSCRAPSRCKAHTYSQQTDGQCSSEVWLSRDSMDQLYSQPAAIIPPLPPPRRRPPSGLSDNCSSRQRTKLRRNHSGVTALPDLCRKRPISLSSGAESSSSERSSSTRQESLRSDRPHSCNLYRTSYLPHMAPP